MNSLLSLKGKVSRRIVAHVLNFRGADSTIHIELASLQTELHSSWPSVTRDRLLTAADRPPVGEPVSLQIQSITMDFDASIKAFSLFLSFLGSYKSKIHGLAEESSFAFGDHNRARVLDQPPGLAG